MGEHIKLRDPGSSHTLRVQSVSVNKAGKWPDYDFTDGNVTVSVPQKAADRQFERLGISSVVELVGANLCVSRTEKTGDNGKPFWDLAIVNAAEANPKPSGRVKPTEADPTKGLPPSFGGPIKGLDDEHPERDEGPPAWHNVPPADEDGYDRFSAAVDALDPKAQPALTPREEREATADDTPAKRFLTFYVDTYAEMLAGLSAVHSAAVSANVGPRSRAPEAIPALTSDTVQAAVATYVIQCERKGWLR